MPLPLPFVILRDFDPVVESSDIDDTREGFGVALTQVSELLEESKLAKQFLLEAKVPIMKFSSMKGNYDVDICINQLNVMATAQSVNLWPIKQPLLRPLMIIKHRLSSENLTYFRSALSKKPKFLLSLLPPILTF